MMLITKEVQEHLLSHFPKKVSSELVDYVENVALAHSRYLFVKTVVGLQQCYCTHCRQGFNNREEKYKHNDIARCKKCDSRCTVKHAGRGRGKLVDYAYVEWFEKSGIDPSVLVARGMYVCRDYREDFKNVETGVSAKAYYVYEKDQATMLHADWNGMRKKKTVFSYCNNVSMPVFSPVEHIKGSVEGTHLQYSMWQKYKGHNLIKFFAFATEHSQVELLTKFGLESVVKAKLLGNKIYRTINWKANSLEKLLKISKSDARGIRDNAHLWTPEMLYILQQLRAEKITWSIDKVGGILTHLGISMRMNEIEYLRKYSPLNKILSYAIRQFKKSRGYYAGYVFIEWRDYLNSCKELEMDTEHPDVLFPHHLQEAHQRNMDRIKMKADEMLNLKIKKRMKQLNKYCFENDGFIFRPFKSSHEIIYEGNKLHHCIGGYAKKYAEGISDLFVIRKANKPNTPFYSVEIIDGKVIQLRGFKNAPATQEVQAFIDAFEKNKLSKKKVSEAV